MKLKGVFFSIILFGIFSSHCQGQIDDFNTIDFSKADSIAMACYNFKLDNLPLLSHRLTSDLNTDVEKFRAIYIWVCANIKNDKALFLRNKRKRHKFKDDSENLRSWNKTLKPLIFKKLKQHNKTICSGYSYLIKILSTLSGLECEFVPGYGRTSLTSKGELEFPNHAWNAVKLNGKWYLCDATWASGLTRAAKRDISIYEGYFLTDPKLFLLNHLPLHSQWTLLPNIQMGLDKFFESPIYYNYAFNYIEAATTPTSLINTLAKDEKFSFQYRLKEPIKASKISLMIVKGQQQTIVSPSSLKINDTSISFEYQFKNSGRFDLHLLIDSTFIASYTFLVSEIKKNRELSMR